MPFQRRSKGIYAAKSRTSQSFVTTQRNSDAHLTVKRQSSCKTAARTFIAFRKLTSATFHMHTCKSPKNIVLKF